MSREIVSCVGFGARALRKSDSGTPYDTYSHTLVRCRSHQSLTVRTLCLKPLPERTGRRGRIPGYFDETPAMGRMGPSPRCRRWGSHITAANLIQPRICWLSAVGELLRRLVVFMVSIALPLIADEFSCAHLRNAYRSSTRGS